MMNCVILYLKLSKKALNGGFEVPVLPELFQYFPVFFFQVIYLPILKPLICSLQTLK